MNKISIVFMGTPDFAVESLRQILLNGFEVKAVVTVADKPAGRGLKLRLSPVKDPEWRKYHRCYYVFSESGY